MNAYVRNYLCSGLAASPLVLETLLAGITDAQADARPDPDRFTIREVVAHLADWKHIWLERFTRIATEDSPFLEDIDEGEMAIQHDYAHADVTEQLRRFFEGRERVVAFFRGLPEDAWAREGVRHWGALSLAGFAGMMLGHDGYHFEQVIRQRDA
jgi:hypothetical protein